MNERLKELMIKAGYAAPEIAGRANILSKLIVEDCLEIINNPINYNRYVYTTFDKDRANGVAQALADKIKEHFKDTQ